MTAQNQSETTHGNILIVDDELHQRRILGEAARSLGYYVVEAESGQKALEQLRFGHFDVLLTDLQMPGMDGLRLLENARIFDSTVSTIMITAHGSIETAVEAMKKGAEDYLLKPIELPALEIALEKIFHKRALVQKNQLLQSENENLKKELGIRFHVVDTIGRGPKAVKLQELVQKYMKTRTPVFIVGAPGTGKDDLGRMIHYNSPWADHSLIFFDCAVVPEELHEIQLFGEESKIEGGVRTLSRPGLVERAHLGTLVLSNIEKLARKCQPNLSKVLREEKLQRTGGSRFYAVNVRIIATSQKREVTDSQAQEGLRWDLYDLLNENLIDVPSLKDRPEDIPVLTAATAKRVGIALGKTIEKIDKAVVDGLQTYDFPGNLRELTAIVEAAVIRCNGTELKLEHFAFPLARG